MSRRYRGPVGSGEPIEVTEGVGGEPAAFRWRGRRYAVHAVIATWVEATPWWVDQAGGQRPVQRQAWRVEAAARAGTTGVYDLYRISHDWGLDRVLD